MIKSTEYRIYANDELRCVCFSAYSFGCNISKLREQFGAENVTWEEVPSILDQKKMKWLETLHKGE